MTSIFETLYFLKWCQCHYVNSQITTIFTCWPKIYYLILYPTWKLDNPYYHNRWYDKGKWLFKFNSLFLSNLPGEESWICNFFTSMTSRKGNGNAISQPNSIADWNSGPEESAYTVNASLYDAGSIQILT